MHTHTIITPKQIRSDTSACGCQEHVESTEDREREELGERHNVYMGCDMPGSVWQDHGVPTSSTKLHTQYKRNGIQEPRSEGDMEERLSLFSLPLFIILKVSGQQKLFIIQGKPDILLYPETLQASWWCHNRTQHFGSYFENRTG